MTPLWYQSLSAEFRDKLEHQEMIDLTFYCLDGSIGAHQIMIALSSNFLNDVLSSLKVYDIDLSVIVPDLTVSQVSAFLTALYGGSVVETTFKTLLEVVELFYVDLTSPGFHLQPTEMDLDPVTVIQDDNQTMTVIQDDDQTVTVIQDSNDQLEEIVQTQFIIPGNYSQPWIYNLIVKDKLECYATPSRLWRESRNLKFFIEPSSQRAGIGH